MFCVNIYQAQVLFQFVEPVFMQFSGIFFIKLHAKPEQQFKKDEPAT